MPADYNYPADLQREEDGRHVVAFPDPGWGATDGATREEALAETRNLLRELIATTIREGNDLPEPSPPGEERPVVVPPVQIALKAALDDAWRAARISRRQFACYLDVAENEVRRMLNPDHATKAATIDRALRRLGKRLSVTVSEAVRVDSLAAARPSSVEPGVNATRRASRCASMAPFLLGFSTDFEEHPT